MDSNHAVRMRVSVLEQDPLKFPPLSQVEYLISAGYRKSLLMLRPERY